MEDCDSETLLDWITASKKLKLDDAQIVASLEIMLANIHADTRIKMQKQFALLKIESNAMAFFDSSFFDAFF